MITETFSDYTAKQYSLALQKWGQDNSKTVNFGSNDTQMFWYFEDENGPIDTVEGLPSKSDLEALINTAESEDSLIRLRSVRDEKLNETDWWAVSDRTMTQDQIDYRQALRDITATYTSLDEVVWPTKPE